jgi:drug/metabolite transporter (DMT)-like permease
VAIARSVVFGRALTDNAADTIRGIGLVALAYMVLSVGDAAAKWAVLSVGVAWVLLWRGVFGAASIVAVTATRTQAGGWRRLQPVRWRMVFLRAGLSSFSSFAWYLCWRHMQLADTYALGFTAPLIMTLLAIPMLGERIRWRRMLSTLLGFSGVLVMLRPGGDPHHGAPTLPHRDAGVSGVLADGLALCYWDGVAGGVSAGSDRLARGVAGAGRAGDFQWVGTLRVHVRLWVGSGLGAGAIRIHHDDLGWRRWVRRVRRGPVLEHAGRCGDRGGGGAI